MMNKFWYLVKYGLKKKFKSKSFIISNIVICALLLIITNIDSIISFFGGDFNETTNIYVLDNTSNSFDSLKINYENLKESVGEDIQNINIEKSEKQEEELLKDIEDTKDIVVVLNEDKENYLNAKVVTENYIDTLTYQILVQSINNTKYQKALIDSKIDMEELEKISAPPEIERVILDDSKSTEEENMNTVMSVVFPTVIMPFFMLILLLVQMIGGEINEEKSTRSMEVIISNVSAKVHFFSKLISNNLFVIIQSVLVFLYGFIGFKIRSLSGVGMTSSIASEVGSALDSLKNSGIMDKLYYIIPLTIVLILLSFAAYSLIAAILASMTVNQEDYQHIQSPIIIICLIGYYLAIMASMFDGSILIKVLSYVPLISFLLSPALLVIGQIGIIDVMISIGVLILLIFVLIKYGLKIYKIGILNYSTDKMWKKIFKAAKM